MTAADPRLSAPGEAETVAEKTGASDHLDFVRCGEGGMIPKMQAGLRPEELGANRSPPATDQMVQPASPAGLR